MFAKLFGKETPKTSEEEETSSPKQFKEYDADDIIKEERVPSISTRSTPVKYEDLYKEAKNILSSQENWDGFRFEFNTTFQDDPQRNFGVSHAISMGSAMEPASYHFGANVLFNKTLLVGRVDTDGHVFGRMHKDITPNFILKASAQASPEAGQSAVQFEADLKGSDWFGNAKWGPPSTYGISFIKTITPRLSCGLETIYADTQAASMLSAGFRYETPNYIFASQFLPRQLSASYVQKITNTIQLATELQLAVAPDTIATQVATGLEAFYRSAHIRAHVDSNWKVSVVVEEMLNPLTKFSVCAELDHKKKSYRFGFGVSYNI